MQLPVSESALEPVILPRQIDGQTIGQRQTDGYVNATELCKAARKKWSHYWGNDSTREFIQALAKSTGIPADSLVEAQSGRGGGTWVHPQVATHLAQWLSPRFAVAVSEWVLDILTTGRAGVRAFSGDSMLDLLQTTQLHTGLLIDMRKQQLEQGRRLNTVEEVAGGANAKADYAVGAANAAVRAICATQGYSTVDGYARRIGKEIPPAEATGFGKTVAAHCRKYGIEVREVDDDDFGRVNLYPDGVLADLFDQVYGAANR